MGNFLHRVAWWQEVRTVVTRLYVGTLLCILLAPLVSSCGSGDTGSTNVRDVSQGTGFAETSVAVVPTEQQRNYVVGFNNYHGGSAWAVSTDLGATWTRHTVTDPGFFWGNPPELPQGATIHYSADPTLVPTSHPNQVAYVEVPGFGQGSVVAIALSTDGGIHFGNPHLVSTPESGPVDQPVAAENDITGDIWVFWRQVSSAHHGWIRKIRYDAAGNLFFVSDPTIVQGLPVNPYWNVNIVAGNFHGQTHIALAYPDQDDNAGCPPTFTGDNNQFYQPIDLNYYLADSVDDTHTWQSVKIAHDSAWPRCVTGDNSAPNDRYNRNRPALAFANSFQVALTLSSPTGSLVHLYEVDWPLKVIGNGTNWPPPDDKRHDQFGPAIAVNRAPNSHNVVSEAVTWHDTRGDFSGSNQQQYIWGVTLVFSTNSSVFQQGIVSQLPNTPKLTWMNNDTSGASWGDYESLAADNVSSTFIAAWADNRAGGDTEVWAAVLRPFS